MKKINKLIAGVASAAMIVTAFSACGSASSSGKKLDFITGMATGCTFEDAAVHYRRV